MAAKMSATNISWHAYPSGQLATYVHPSIQIALRGLVIENSHHDIVRKCEHDTTLEQRYIIYTPSGKLTWKVTINH